MSSEGGGEDGKFGKIPQIPWRSDRDPANIAQKNLETVRNRGLEGDFEKSGEQNRNALLVGIDREMIEITRRKCEIIIRATAPEDRVQAEGMIDAMIKTHHPKHMVSILHEINPATKTGDLIGNAAIAFAFLAMTEGY